MNIIRISKIYIIFKNSYLNLLILRIRKKYKDAVVSKKTLLVVEGFPRSANTFTFNIFKGSLLKLNVDPVGKIAHHIHATAQIKTAVRNKIPTLVIIRQPADAIASYILKKYGTYSIKNIKKIIDIDIYYWIYFYSYVYKLRKRLVISSFNEVINNYDRTIDKINNKFNANFYIIEPSEKITNEIFDSIRQKNMIKVDYNEKKLAVPSIEKEYDKNRIKEIILSSKNYNKANNIYDLIEKYTSK